MTWTLLALYGAPMGPELHALVIRTLETADLSSQLIEALLKAATNYRRLCA